MDDVEDDRNGALFAPEIDYSFEAKMNEEIEWLDDGHFVAQDFLKSLDDGSDLSLPTERPLRVHTYIRNEYDMAYQHNKHPFVAFVHLLEKAEKDSEVYLSSPYLTDKHIIDQLAHFAKPLKEGGSNLNIRIVLGPEEYNKEVLTSFVGHSLQRYWAVNRLKIRTYGHSETEYMKVKMVHAKSIVTSCGTMIGSYNYTWGSRLRHREDCIVLGPGSIADEVRQDIKEVWGASTDYSVENPSKRKAQAAPIGPPPPGYKPARTPK